MKVLALNVWRGGRDRLPGILDYAIAQRPDVVVLTEWHAKFNSAGKAAFHGMTIATLNDGSSPNGVLIAARQPFRPASITPATGSAGVLMQV